MRTIALATSAPLVAGAVALYGAGEVWPERREEMRSQLRAHP